MKISDRGKDFNIRNYFLFGILLVELIKFRQLGLPSMSKREIVEKRLIEV